MDELDLEILTILTCRPCYGYELKYLLEDRRFTIPHSNLYRELRVLGGEGLIAFHTVASRKGPVKKVYSITEKGETVLTGLRQNGAYLVLARYLESLGNEYGSFIEEEFQDPKGREASFLGLNRASWPMARPIAKALIRLSGPDSRPVIMSESPLLPNKYLDTILGEMTTIPLADECIDFAVLPVLLLDKLDKVLEELYRILVPGGTFFTTHPLPSDVVSRSRLTYDLITAIPPHLLPFPTEERISLIRELDDYFAVMNVPRQDASFLICQKEE